MKRRLLKELQFLYKETGEVVTENNMYIYLADLLDIEEKEEMENANNKKSKLDELIERGFVNKNK